MISCLCDRRGYQWSEPNSWAPLNYVAVCSLERNGLKAEAKELADKCMKATEDIF